MGQGYPYCPIGDTPGCRWTFQDGKSGVYSLWDPQDYLAFSRAFLRNEKLVDAFLKPEFISKSKPELKKMIKDL